MEHIRKGLDKLKIAFRTFENSPEVYEFWLEKFKNVSQEVFNAAIREVCDLSTAPHNFVSAINQRCNARAKGESSFFKTHKIAGHQALNIPPELCTHESEDGRYFTLKRKENSVYHNQKWMNEIDFCIEIYGAKYVTDFIKEGVKVYGVTSSNGGFSFSDLLSNAKARDAYKKVKAELVTQAVDQAEGTRRAA